MSEHLTHIAVYEDCVRIMNQIPEKFPEAFLISLEKSYESGMICSGSRGNHIFSMPLLKEAKKRWEKDQSEEVTQMIAGALGWLTHRGADRTVKPIFKTIENENSEWFNGHGCRVHHDASTLRNIYKGGAVTTKTETEYINRSTLEAGLASTHGSQALDVERVEALLSFYWLQEFADLHSFTENYSALGMVSYVDKLIQEGQEFTQNLNEYYKAFQDPNPAERIKYLEHYKYYDENDPIIKIVRASQLENKTFSSEEVLDALEQAKNQSLYAQALRLSYDNLLAASAFFNDEISEDTARKRMEMN